MPTAFISGVGCSECPYVFTRHFTRRGSPRPTPYRTNIAVGIRLQLYQKSSQISSSVASVASVTSETSVASECLEQRSMLPETKRTRISVVKIQNGPYKSGLSAYWGQKRLLKGIRLPKTRLRTVFELIWKQGTSGVRVSAGHQDCKALGLVSQFSDCCRSLLSSLVPAQFQPWS